MRPVAMLLVLAAPTVALAHDTWLLPSRAAVTRSDVLILEMTSAMRFPEPEMPVKADRLARTGLRLGGTTVPLRPEEGGVKALRLSVTPRTDGVATVWAESLPRDIDLKPAAVDEYLAEAGATEVHEQWKKMGRGRWHETYVKHAKSFVTVGEVGDDRSWADPVGMALEIVPDVDPSRLASGRQFSVHILEDGKPAVGLTVAARAANSPGELKDVTDAGGHATFTLTKSGPWLVKAIRIRPGDDPGAWRSRFTTLTLHVLPSAVR
jgi:uncharacterized GH25 family protein